MHGVARSVAGASIRDVLLLRIVMHDAGLSIGHAARDSSRMMWNRTLKH
jgi:hypothetical protein